MRIALYFLIAVSMAMLGAVSFTSGRSASASDAPPDSRLIVAVDSFAAAASERDALVADSVTRLAAGADNGASIALMTYGRTPGETRQYEYGSAALIEGLDKFQSLVRTGFATGEPDQFQAIAAAFDYLSDLDAPAASRLLLITPNGMDRASQAARDRLISLVELFRPQGWVIDIAVLPSATVDARSFLARVAETSDGKAYDTGAIDGLSNFAADTFGVTPQPVIQTVLERGATALSPINVPPHSEQMIVSATRRTAHTTIELFDPRGAPVNPARSSVTLIETEAAILIRIISPEAGQWTARALGDESELLIGVDIDNDLSIELVDTLPLPVGETALLAAQVSDAGVKIIPEGAWVDATVTSPSGSVVYRLNDTGLAGDAVAGDGVFSVRVPPFAEQVFSRVDLVLHWDNYAATVRDSASLQAENFPSISLKSLAPGPIDQGEMSPIAEIEITKADFPFPVDPAELTVTVVSPHRADVEALVVPADSIDGKAWRFRVSAAPESTGDYQVDAMLDTEYLGRAFSDGAVVGALPIGVIPRPVFVPPPEPTLLDRVPVWAWAVIAVALAVAFVVAVQRLISRSQTLPYGYLCDDSGSIVVSFRRVPQGLLQRLFARNRIPAASLPGLAIGAGQFVFGTNGVRLETSEAMPNLRVNGRPAGRVTTLADQVRLGVGGRLLTFMTRLPSPGTLGPQAGD